MYLSSLFLLQLDESISSASVERGFSIIEQYIRAFPPYHFGITEIRDLWDVCKDFPEFVDYPNLYSCIRQTLFEPALNEKKPPA